MIYYKKNTLNGSQQGLVLYIVMMNKSARSNKHQHEQRTNITMIIK